MQQNGRISNLHRFTGADAPDAFARKIRIFKNNTSEPLSGSEISIGQNVSKLLRENQIGAIRKVSFALYINNLSQCLLIDYRRSKLCQFSLPLHGLTGLCLLTAKCSLPGERGCKSRLVGRSKARDWLTPISKRP